MISETLLDDCKSLALTIRPELGDDLLVIDAKSLTGQPKTRSCYGWCASGQYFHDFANQIPGYRGGAVIAFDEEKIRQDLAHPDNFERCLRSVLVHEAAHPLPQRERAEAKPTHLPIDVVVAFERLKTAHDLGLPATNTPFDAAHDLQFCRRAIHCFVRAVEAGADVLLPGLFSDAVWPSRESSFLELLLGESLAMRGATFAEIEAQPVPAKLLAQWDADNSYHARCFGPKERTLG